MSSRLSLTGECDECLSKCPKNPVSKRIFLCRQCGSDATCIIACPKGAIVEDNGVVKIIDEKCNGCGECASACPNGAILMQGKATKCDLCAGFSKPQCLCDKIKLESFQKMPFGWEVVSGEYTLQFPELSEDEKFLLLDIYEKFKQNVAEKNIPIVIRNFIFNYCEQNNLIIDMDQFEYLVTLAVSNIFSYGPFDQLFEDENIEEITIVGKNPAFVYLKNQGWKKTNFQFYDEKKLLEIANKMALKLGKRLTLKTPRINSVLPNGDRLHASIPPLSLSGVELTIRKFKKRPITVFDLISSKMFTAEAIAFLQLCMNSDVSILIAGNTASGKTSTLNALFSFVPDERIIIIEETPEIKIQQNQVVKMMPSGDVSMSDLIADTMRMRPDRTIIGEVRTSEEINALFNTLLSGQARSIYSTIHAQNSTDAISRLKFMGINELDLNTLDLIIIQKRMLNAKKGIEIRRCTEIYDVKSKIKLFEYNFKKDTLCFNNNVKSAILDKLSLSYGLTKKQLLFELKKYEKKLLGGVCV